MLEEKNDQAIEAALLALHKLRTVRTPDILPQILPHLENPLHTVNALWVISEIADKSFAPRLLRFLFFPDPKIRSLTIIAICRLDYTERLDILLYMLHDKDPHVSANACHKLTAYIHEERVINILLYYLRSNNELSAAAAQTLGRAKYAPSVDELIFAVRFGSEKLAASALDALWKIQGQALEAFYIEQALSHPLEHIRYLVLRFGCINRSQKALETFIFIVENDSSYKVQARAIHELSCFTASSALQTIENWNKYHRRNDDT
jgi:hypothetical protein